jgi:hypothetical protein
MSERSERIIELNKLLDDCWCDDGRNMPECLNCRTHRRELQQLQVDFPYTDKDVFDTCVAI